MQIKIITPRRAGLAYINRPIKTAGDLNGMKEFPKDFQRISRHFYENKRTSVDILQDFQRVIPAFEIDDRKKVLLIELTFVSSMLVDESVWRDPSTAFHEVSFKMSSRESSSKIRKSQMD